jgi:CBS domain-containing protein
MTTYDICRKPAVTIEPNDSLIDAARRMRAEHVGDLVVVDDARHPIGVLTDRDIVVSAVAQSPEALTTLLVGDVMTLDPVTARAYEPVEAALGRMTRRGVRRLPIVDDEGALCGIVTLDDVVRALSHELSSLVGTISRERRQEELVRG